MVYLIQEILIHPDTGKQYNLLKIGYTGDKGKDIRFSSYHYHCPLSKVLYTISDGTKKDEKNLQRHFLKYKCEFLNEWFYYDEEIIDFFKSSTIKEDLELLKTRVKKKEIEIRGLLRSMVFAWSHIDSSFNIDNYHLYIKELTDRAYGLETEEDCYNFLCRKYPESKEYVSEIKEFINGTHKLLEIPSTVDIDRINQTLKKFKELYRFEDRFKLICNCSKDEIPCLLNRVNKEFKQYYEILGPARCRSINYRKDLIKKDILAMRVDKNELAERIYSAFEVGKRYSKAYIKEKLGEIYDDLKYNKYKPKATDLEQYFELSSCSVNNPETKNRDHGFKILGKK